MNYETVNRKRTGIGFVLAVYAASRMFYLISGSLFATVVPTSSFQRITSDVPSGSMNIWSHWDGEHYVALAMGGYLNPPDNVSPAFFPMYPLLMRSFSELFGGPLSKEALSVWGPLLSLAFLPFALYFIYHIALDGWGERVARGSVLAIALFPTTFFLNAAYTESLFLALSAGSIWAMRVRKDLLLACVLGGFAAATRNVGMFLVVPLMYEWVRGGGMEEGRERLGGLASLALVPGGLIAYMGYLWLRFGDPLLFYSAQEYWNRRHTDPVTLVANIISEAFESLGSLFGAQPPAASALGNVVERLHGANDFYALLFLLFTLALFALGFRVLPLSLSLYTLLLLISAVTFGKPETPLMGFSRYILVAFPLFITLATLLESRRAMGAWLSFSAAVSLVFCAFFVSWRFVA
ncbi:MAG TPA: mannosyltransferase family protein [Rubrobacter sp.]|nr:mannosyltransferase family protein [Rubrobacter sp.]